jgi:hypothetical protein
MLAERIVKHLFNYISGFTGGSDRSVSVPHECCMFFQPQRQTDMVKIQLPGFGRPLNYVPRKRDPQFIGPLFPNALALEEEDVTYV